MRRTVLISLLASCLASLAFSVAVATTFYRWVDADGIVHYSDRPAPGSKKIEVEDSRPAAANSAASLPRAKNAAAAPAIAAPYTSCEILHPSAEQTLVNVWSVTVELDLQPELRPGDSVVLQYDGNPAADQPPRGTSFVLTSVVRGAHNIAAKVVDLSGRTVCQSGAVTFYVRQPSVLSPTSPLRRPKTS
jgi:hypothetical protein